MVRCQPASLYVGDLDLGVTEAMIFAKFSTVGTVLSVRVCRDFTTGRSLGYAYVNFGRRADAERALDTLNFDVMNGRPIRIMWSQRDPSLRQSGVGNVFVKNLDRTISSRALYDIFSAFGNILSCKVVQDENGASKGYGFVHYETQEAANRAIEHGNGMHLNGKKVYVGGFIPRRERAANPILFTNVYVKNFGEDFTDTDLRKLFEKYGRITSCTVARDDDGNSKGFGFVAFERHDAAKTAVKHLHGKEVAEGKRLCVVRAQKKAERLQMLERRLDNNIDQPFTLYVKNLDRTIDDERLRYEFAPFGTITSARVIMSEGRSKGFGFVTFTSPEEATRALTAMNGRIIGLSPIYVALAHTTQSVPPSSNQQAQRNPTIPQDSANSFANARRSFNSITNVLDALRALTNPSLAPRVQRCHGTTLCNRTRNTFTTSVLVNPSLQDYKQILGERLYPLVERICPELAGKITGMLLVLDIFQVLHLLRDNEALRAKVDEAMAALFENWARQQTNRRN